MDGVVGQTGGTVAPRHLRAEQVPTVRLTLRTGSSSRTGWASSNAPSASWISV